ncbi:MAG: transglutaminase-like domain-containing protein [Candidatus Hodarchaeales archaeon]
MKDYLSSTETINFDRSEINEKAKDLTKDLENAEDKAKALFYYVRDEIKYRVFTSYPDFDDFKATAALEKKVSFCIPKAILLISLARVSGIPARLHFADIRNLLLPPSLHEAIGTDVMLYHGYVGLYINGKWVKLNPAFDKDLCKRHDLIPVDFEGSADALFHRHDRKGRIHIEYLKDRGHFADYNREMYDEMISTFKEYYNPLMKQGYPKEM